MMKKLTGAEITALLWQDLAKAYAERAEQLLRATAEPETHLELAEQWRQMAERCQVNNAVDNSGLYGIDSPSPPIQTHPDQHPLSTASTLSTPSRVGLSPGGITGS